MAAAIAEGWSLLSLKEIRQHDDFSGRESDFEAWAFPFEAEAEELGWGHLVQAAITHTEPIANSTLNAAASDVSKNLYLWLSLKMKGKAQTIVKLAGHGNGFDALRQVYAEFRPSGNTSTHGMLATIIQPHWWTKQPHKDRPYTDVLLDWDQLIAQYELASGERITNATRCATVLGFAPQEIKAMLKSAARSTRENHQEMRVAIRDSLLGASEASFVPKAMGQSFGVNSDAMDVGAIGFDKPRCQRCHKLGHEAKDCWAELPKGSTKGAGKGKDKRKGDRNPEKPDAARQKECYYCHKMGHLKKDCRKFKADQDKKKGTGQVSVVALHDVEDAAEVHLCQGCSPYDLDDAHWVMPLLGQS